MEATEADCKQKSHGEHTKPAAKNDLITDCINCLPNGRKRMSRDTGFNEKIEKDIKKLENVLKFENENAIVEHLNELISMIHLAEIDQLNGRLKAKNKGETLLHIALKLKNTHEFIKEYLSKHPKGVKEKRGKEKNTKVKHLYM